MSFYQKQRGLRFGSSTLPSRINGLIAHGDRLRLGVETKKGHPTRR